MDKKLERLLKTNICPSENNTKIFGSVLSHDSFISYSTYKLKNARVMWVNRRYFLERNIDFENIDDFILENYAYVTETYAQENEIDRQDKRVFLADRYGCHAPISNGGSSRCGVNGEFQVKGNGVNPLVGMNIDEGHSDGMLCLAEAVGEAIWGEICHNNLPHGALRTVAIISTNRTFMSDHGLGELIEQPAAIAIREWCIRPAHYERALYYWPYPEYHYLRDLDHVYVQKNIELFVSDCDSKEISIKDRLIQSFRKIAEQVAASRIKGIPHGSLSSSNIGIEGEFLDFGTITAVPDFDNYLLSGGMGATWDDHRGISSWIKNVTYYFVKYGKGQLVSQDVEDIQKEFLCHIKEKENYYTALECGLNLDSSLTYSDLERLGEKIKIQLRDGLNKEKMMEKFDVKSFKMKVIKILEELKIEKFRYNFLLRDMFFTKYIIVKNPLLTDMAASSVLVSKLIDEYAVKSMPEK
ncbi:protein adenylyltransferase SelO family protein [Thaumasiovibrio subtropicus]|uniref:protein adenylyltransferase SelO family protein n=2 Tax=Thaumasiovibrio subtropicus TaxID=1891207 RepID=UPI001C85B73F|nr:protein adenylyltransferase SelO family protein [Thaumasiovibrio subtropicus]